MTETPYHAMYRRQVSTWIEPPLPRERFLSELEKLRDLPRTPGWEARLRNLAIRLMVLNRHGGAKVNNTEVFLDILIDLYRRTE